MKLRPVLSIFALLLLVSLTACDVVSNPTPPPANTPALATTPTSAAATSPTTVALAATATSVPISLTSGTAAPTSTPVTINLPPATNIAPTDTPAAASPLTSTAAPPADTPTASANSTPAANTNGELIFFVGNDGTIYSIAPDGTNQQPIITIDKSASQDVGGMSVSADGKYLAYSLYDTGGYTATYYLVSNGTSSPLDGVSSLPVWYGHRFVAAGQPDRATGAAELSVYDADQPGPSSAGLGVIGSEPAWYPDGSKVVYTDQDDNIYSIGAYPPPYGNLAPDPILKLNDKPASSDNQDFFGTMFVAVTPDSKTLVFGGEQIKKVGASGNGQRLWSYDLSKGAGQSLSDAHPFTDFGGRYGGSDNYGFTNANTIVVASDFHISACAVGSVISILKAGSGAAFADINLPGVKNETYARIYGLSAAPNIPARVNPTFAYSTDNYTCDNAGAGPNITQPPAVYVWNQDAQGKEQSNKVADGRYPIWVDTALNIAPAPTLVPGESNPPTDTPGSAATATPQSAAPAAYTNSQLLFYLASDGKTLNTMNPDGSDARLVTVVDLKQGQQVSGISASKDGEYLAYAVTTDSGTHYQTDYYLVLNGKSTKIDTAYSLPVWYGHRFVANTLPTQQGDLGELAVYDANKNNGFTAAGLGVQGSNPAWSPDGKSIIYLDTASAIREVDANPAANGQPQPTTLLDLNSGVSDKMQKWAIAWATFAPDSHTLIFDGAQQENLGAAGMGGQIWLYDVSSGKGKDGLVGVNDNGLYYAPEFLGNNALFTLSADHAGVCGSTPRPLTVDLGSSTPNQLALSGMSADTIGQVSGFSAAPNLSGGYAVAYSIQPFDCKDGNVTPTAPSAIYIWTSNTLSGGTSKKIADGSDPVWIDTGH